MSTRGSLSSQEAARVSRPSTLLALLHGDEPPIPLLLWGGRGESGYPVIPGQSDTVLGSETDLPGPVKGRLITWCLAGAGGYCLELAMCSVSISREPSKAVLALPGCGAAGRGQEENCRRSTAARLRIDGTKLIESPGPARGVVMDHRGNDVGPTQQTGPEGGGGRISCRF